MSVTRLITPGDAPALAELVRVNRDFLAPWEPAHGEAYYTADGQRAHIEDALVRYGQGTHLPLVILSEAGRVAGRVNLNSIVRGAAQSGSLGYWLGAADNGRGLATAAVREIVGIGFRQLRLHRVEAGTVLHNARSQRVLERNGFARFGMAPAYLKIAGQWQDHILYQVLNPDPV